MAKHGSTQKIEGKEMKTRKIEQRCKIIGTKHAEKKQTRHSALYSTYTRKYWSSMTGR
jgi:hypothetical protein